MPLVYAVSSSLWSLGSTWNSGTVPTASDDVYANAKTVIIDQNVNAISLRNIASGSAATGGQFRVSGSYIITCAGPNSGIYGGSTSEIAGCLLVFNKDVGITNNVTINSNIYSGGGLFAMCVQITGSNNVNIVGTIDHGAGDGSGASLWIRNNGTVNVVGNVLSANNGSSNSSGILIASPGSGSVNITGDLFNRSTDTSTRSITYSSAASSSLSITGNINPIATAGNIVVSSTTTNTKLIIVGNINSAFPSPTVSPIVLSSTSQSVDLTGNVFASLSVPAVTVMNPTSNLILRGTNLVNSFQNPGFSIPAIFSPCINIVPSNQFRWTFYNAPSSSLNSTLFVQGYVPDSPSQADVRFGTTYLNGALSGSLQMPQPSQVISGVKTDNTTGSYNVTVEALTEAVWSKLTSTLTGSNTIGERLKNNSTIDSTGQQLQALI